MKLVSDLVPNPQNPRTISDAKLEMLRKSLSEFGDLSGVVFNRTTGHLVGGHQRIKLLPTDAAIHTTPGDPDHGHVFTPDGQRLTVRFVDWDETKEKAANIAANQHGGDWDLPQLSEWLLELDAANVDMDLTGFDSGELEDMMAPVTKLPPGADDDSVPTPPVSPTAIRGDVYQLGRHRLMCGDATAPSDVDALLEGEHVDLLFTDPPYGMSVVKKQGLLHGVGIKGACDSGVYRPVLGDDSTRTAIDAFNLCAAMEIPVMVFWGANFYAEALPPSSGWICWDKENGEDFFADGELAWTNTDRQLRIVRHQWKGMIKASERGEKRVHPTQKPVAVAEWTFDKYAPTSVTVMDLFGGSGSTLIACEKTERICYMMELDPQYVDTIIARWEKFTGQKATLIPQFERDLDPEPAIAETN